MRTGGRCWQFTGSAEHRVFGWLQVDEIITVGEDPRPALSRYPWLAKHPHLALGWPASNTVYVAREDLAPLANERGTRGFGVLRNGVRLTSRSSTQPSTWTVPAWLNPLSGGTGLTYNPGTRWSPDNTLRAAARGQEFIANIGDRQDAIEWIMHALSGEGEC